MARPALTVALSLLVLALLLSVVPRGALARDVSVDAGGHVADAFDDAGDAFDEYDDGEEGGYDDDGDMGGFDDGSHFHDDGDAHGDEEDERKPRPATQGVLEVCRINAREVAFGKWKPR